MAAGTAIGPRLLASTLSAHGVGSPGARTGADTVAVLHIVAPCEVGGLERIVPAVGVGKRCGGHRVSVVAVLGDKRQDHPFLPPLREAGVEVVPLYLAPRAYLSERAAVVEVCRRLRPDVVHTHGYRADVVDAAATRRLGVPTVTTVHGFCGGDLKNRIYQLLQRRGVPRFRAGGAGRPPPGRGSAPARVP